LTAKSKPQVSATRELAADDQVKNREAATRELEVWLWRSGYGGLATRELGA
jgi:hypothetical protein